MTPFLLVSTGSLNNSIFARSLVLIWHKDEHGATGIIINHPSKDPARDWLEYEVLEDSSDVGFVGGPVDPDEVVILSSQDGIGVELIEGLSIVDYSAQPEFSPKHKIRLFSGYCGWAPGQLEAEILEKAWTTASFLAEDVFAEDLDALWRGVITRLSQRYQFLSSLAATPGNN